MANAFTVFARKRAKHNWVARLDLILGLQHNLALSLPWR
jgi:hypothetical protein